MKITFVRHTEVEESFVGKYNGHNDISLSAKGIEDAKELGEKLQNSSFDLVYASDLKRVQQTLFYLNREEKIITTSMLREKSWGKHEGMSFEEIVASGIEYENFSQWLEALDGERVEEYLERLKEYFYGTILTKDTQNVLIVTHSGVIKSVVGFCRGLGVEDSFAIKLAYGEVVEVEL